MSKMRCVLHTGDIFPDNENQPPRYQKKTLVLYKNLRRDQAGITSE